MITIFFMPELRLRQPVLLIELMTPLLNIVKGSKDSKNKQMKLCGSYLKLIRLHEP